MESAEATDLLAHHPSTKGILIAMTETPRDKKDPRYSSQIDAYGYSPEYRTVCIRFKHGMSEYHYHHTDPEKAAQLETCESFGRWVGHNLKNVHHCERVREPSYYKGT